MKVELKANGVMVVEPENELESYALRVWWKKHNTHKGEGDETLLVDYRYNLEKLEDLGDFGIVGGKF